MNTRTYPMLTSAPPLGARRQGGGTSAHKQTNASQHLPHLHFLLLIKHLYIYDEVHITRRLFSPAVVVGPGARRRDMVPHQGLVTTRLLVRRPTVLPVVLVPRAHPGVVVGRSVMCRHLSHVPARVISFRRHASGISLRPADECTPSLRPVDGCTPSSSRKYQYFLLNQSIH